MNGTDNADLWNPFEIGRNSIEEKKKLGTTYWLVERYTNATTAERLGAEMAKFGPFADLFSAVRAAKKRIKRIGAGVEIKVEYGINKAVLY